MGLNLEDEETGQEQAKASLELIGDEAPVKTKPVRRALPDHLPRTDVRFMPDGSCAGCGGALDDTAKTLGEDVMENLSICQAVLLLTALSVRAYPAQLARLLHRPPCRRGPSPRAMQVQGCSPVSLSIIC